MSGRRGIAKLIEVLFGIRGIKISKYIALRLKTISGKAPYTALNDLDKKIIPYLPEKGFFIEAGGNDGVDQSNTYFLEKRKGWDGVLIEPFRPLSELSKAFRSATTICAALGPPENEGSEIQMDFRDLQSSMVSDVEAQFRWGGWLGSNPSQVTAPVRTLSSILDDIRAPQVTLLSLDVEGFELDALRGLDLTRHRPSFVLIETKQIEEVIKVIGPEYVIEGKLSHHDYLLRDTAPIKRAA
ncbi:FkbM family methyltransferase [Rhizobium sp. XQZ8]|uniref:FkbM family methyltransferase n=1 Tax=Rhizobium populisoli TaxID=2859785 RepID=UPI001C677006|nr:FkbM family methyltransferase [Rhizobium populisoli]MBW6423343.1 FkbM family methyltransferase [Rhizobium populisoli]